MTPRFTPWEVTAQHPEGAPKSAPEFRGDWVQAANTDHRHRFSVSGAYPGHTVTQADDEAKTTVNQDGYTAIRVNLPPIGFNKARITMEIEITTGNTVKVDLLDLEVPAVVVIDPGHGGSDGGTNSISGKMTEAQVVLDVALKSEGHVREALRAISPNYKLLFTRKTGVNTSIGEGAGVAPGTSRQGIQRYQGADIFLSIHCNSGVASARRVETNIQWGKVPWENLSADAADQGNYNHDYDKVLGQEVNDLVVGSLRTHDPATPDNGVVRNTNPRLVAHGPGVLRDSSTANGNNNSMTPAYHPLRSALVELEFISNLDGDALLISGKSKATPTNPNTWTSDEVREALAAGISSAIAKVIKQ